MYVDLIIWDDPDDEHVNVWHIAASGLTPDDIDFVILGHPGSCDAPDEYSDSSDLPLIFGDAPDGRRIAVIYEDESGDGLVIIRPKTAYPVKRQGD